MNSNKVVIVLEEQNESRDLTHIVSEQAFRYPHQTCGDLYVAGYDKNKQIHFLVVEEDENKEVMLRIVEDAALFDKLLVFFNDDELIKQSVARLPMIRS